MIAQHFSLAAVSSYQPAKLSALSACVGVTYTLCLQLSLVFTALADALSSILLENAAKSAVQLFIKAMCRNVEVFNGAMGGTVCGWIYDEDVEGIPFEEQPEDYTCPACGVPKSFFEKL